MSERARARAVGRAQVVTTAVLFSTGGAAIKATSLGGLEVAALRSAFAAVALALFLAFSSRDRREGRAIGAAGKDRLDLPAIGVALSYAATMTLFVVATKWTTAANAIFLQACAPLFVAPLAYVALGERVERADLALMAALAVGVALFFAGVRAPVVTAPAPMLGNLTATTCAVVWAMTVVGLRRLEAQGRDAARLTLLPGNLFVAVVAAALAPWRNPVHASDLAIVAYLGVVQIAVAYVLLTRGVRRVPALEASLLLLLEPVLSAVWAWLVHGEPVSALAGLGGAVVVSATAARAWLRRRASGVGIVQPREENAAP
jgi:drug/metabolite transporter (DMT)-like permease